MNYNKMYIYTPLEILNTNGQFGSKIFRLAELSNNYPVPAFVGLSKNTINNLKNVDNSERENIYKQVVQEVTNNINTIKYAVRSSAFVEDSIDSSHAGEFLTKLDVGHDELIDAIEEVLFDATSKGYATDDKPFSIIIQEYKEPSIAGVIFTRSPDGKYESIVEWKEGNGMGVVGGQSSKQIIFSCNVLPKKIPFSHFEELVNIAKSIEMDAHLPQDIEWAVVEDKLVILQARPITTINMNQYNALVLLDKELPKSDYYYDRTSLESLNNPLPLAESMLVSLYSSGGAIGVAYQSLGIRYKEEDIHTKFGNALFIDKEKEIMQFFPIYSYFTFSTLAPGIKRLKGLWTTIKNTNKFQNLNLYEYNKYKEIFEKNIKELKNIISTDKDFSEILPVINSVYKDIFLVNLCSDKAYKDLSKALGKYPYSVLQISNSIENSANPRYKLIKDIENKLIGNSLNITDESIFIAQQNKKEFVKNLELIEWWQNLKEQERNSIEKNIKLVHIYEALREEGRWVTVMCMDIAKRALYRKFKENNIDSSLIYFTKLEEVTDNILDESILKERRNLYEGQNALIFPQTISSIPFAKANDIYGVSGGEANGAVAYIGGTITKGNILYVDSLDPSLTKYFDIISGMISREGGMLSHLAIVAREYGIPIVVDHRNDINYIPGQIVDIDGTKGTII